MCELKSAILRELTRYACWCTQKDLVSALRQLHSKRPPPDQVQGFLVAVLNGDEPPAVTPVAKGDDEGVYEYFKAHGVFALLKVRSQHALLCVW